MKKPLLFSCAVLFSLPCPADPIYRSVDKNGRVSFSDTATGNAGEKSIEPGPASARPFDQLYSSVFKPVFQTTRGELAAGKAFVAKVPGCKSPLLITALHLFGPAGGLPLQIEPGNLGASVSRIRLYELKTNKLAAEAPLESYTPNNAHAFDTMSKSIMGAGDVAAFLAPAKVASLALPVSGVAAEKGEKLFVLTPVTSNMNKYAYEAVATGLEDGYLAYNFTDHDFVLQATSGAPVINTRGQVVAINLAGRPSVDGQKLHGLGTPVEKWRNILAQTCAMKTSNK